MTSVRIRADRAERYSADLTLDLHANLVTGQSSFSGYFGTPTSLETDSLIVAASVFAADRACARGEREDYARRIDISIPVVNAGRWVPAQAAIEEVLRALSNDQWRVEFRQIQGDLSGPPTPAGPERGQTLLFSGGLDSLAAAIELQDSAGDFQLVSHVTHGRAVREAQDSLLTGLRSRAPVEHFRFLVSSRSGVPLVGDHATESTQRTRSFMFLLLGAVAGMRTGRTELLIVAENGPLAVHLPLTAARIGAFSTHTAHPDVLSAMAELLGQIFGRRFTIRNPFVSRTKAEVVAIVRRGLAGSIAASSSCWRAARLTGGASHCGQCIPCLIRRIALEMTGTDPTAYGRDVLRENIGVLGPGDEGRRNILDLVEFASRVLRSTNDEVMNAWPELYSENIDAAEAISMYRRFSSETVEVLGRYPTVSHLLM